MPEEARTSDATGQVIDHHVADETAPLLPRGIQRKRRRSRKTSIIAIILLTVVTLVGLVFGFILPQVAQSYVERALDYDIGSISLKSVDERGAVVRVVGDIFINHNKGDSRTVQRLVDAIFQLAGPIAVSDISLQIDLHHDGVHHIASSDLDDLSLRLAGGQKNAFDMLSSVRLHNVEAIGDFAQGVLQHNINHIPLTARVTGKITRLVSIRKAIAKEIDYKLPSRESITPVFNITALAVKDSTESGIVAKASLDVQIESPIDALVPSIVLEASIGGCNGEMIPLAIGFNKPFHVSRNSALVSLQAEGTCSEIPKSALKACATKDGQSPIDHVMQTYLAGNATTIYLTGAKTGTQSWLQAVLSQITVPIQVPGSQTQQFARDIVLSDVRFNLPSFLGGGGKPKISGKVRGTIDVPSQINVAVKVDSVHVLADLIYKGKKFAYVESPGWAPATSRTPTKEELIVEVVLRDAPVTITDDDVFSTVVSNLLGGNVLVDVLGTGDVKVITALGKVEAHQLPIEAKDIEIGGLGFIQGLQPKISQMGVIATAKDYMVLEAEAELNNPTAYSVDAAYLDAHLVFQNHTIGNITVKDLQMVAGSNKFKARLRYAPMLFDDGLRNFKAGSDLLGRYLSELPVKISLQAHKDSLPDYPDLSKSLAHLPLQVSVPVPRIVPDDDDDDGGDDDDDDDHDDQDRPRKSQFLVSAKFHVFSSTASFILRNPLNESITIESLHAVATYHDDEVGTLDYEYPIVLSGTQSETETTRLPVRWKLPPSDILRKAVSGTLRVNATASAMVSVGQMSNIPIHLTLREVGAGVGI